MRYAALALVLFVAALFTKGFTHDLLLEAGVFLVSVKLIMLAQQNRAASSTMQRKLDEVHAAIRRSEDGSR